MSFDFDQITAFILNIPIYLVNGMLWLVYATAGALPALVSVAIAVVTILVVDEAVQTLASSRPLRDGRGGIQVAPKTAQTLTGITITLWLIAQWGVGAPVPWIGASMWVAGLLAILAIPSQQFGLLSFMKKGLLLYAGAVIAGRLYLAYSMQISPGDWASMLGSVDSAAKILANTRANSTSMIMMGIHWIIPLGYFAFLGQQALFNDVSLTNPMATYEQMMLSLKSRGGR